MDEQGSGALESAVSAIDPNKAIATDPADPILSVPSRHTGSKKRGLNPRKLKFNSHLIP